MNERQKQEDKSPLVRERTTEGCAQTETPTLEEFKSELLYCPESGKFFWIKSGKEAGHIVANGRYMGVGFRRRVYKRSRLAWFFMTGGWPKREIDHINRNGLDDRFHNLRDVTRTENTHNRKIHANGRLVGATKDNRNPNRIRWVARVKRNGITRHLGRYKTAQEAHERYMEELDAIGWS